MFDRGQCILAHDAAIFVAEAGKLDGPPVVLLHGGLQSRRSFLPLAPHLASRFRLIAIETRGHGRSAIGIQPMSYRQLEQDILAVLQSLGLTDAALVGHSDGGIVTLRLAASGAIRPRFLVTIGAHADLQAADPVRDLYRDLTIEDWRAQFPKDVADYEAENPTPDFAHLFAQTRRMWLGTGDDAYPGTRIAHIQCPLLVIHGDEDFLVSRRHSVALAEGVEGARLLSLPFASHTAHEDAPEEIAKAIVMLSTRQG